ncbi:unnamed protein product [Protopolystoma xenopodis]|uniref:Uncharacterized protein n=1 Tax=Protopolystoma xenopodis TaxID=117903 RepID=A0A3S5BFS2_9PLAT|nr:unnamed protein product [Protopolystoma xenopodis]
MGHSVLGARKWRSTSYFLFSAQNEPTYRRLEMTFLQTFRLNQLRQRQTSRAGEHLGRQTRPSRRRRRRQRRRRRRRHRDRSPAASCGLVGLEASAMAGLG